MNLQFPRNWGGVPEPEKTVALMQFAGRLAHELNNIFTAVIGNMVLLDDAEGAGEHTAFAGMRKGIERGIELSSNLQAYAGRQALKRRHVDIGQVTAETIFELRDSFLAGIHLRMNLGRDHCLVLLDEEKYRAALVEIARNSCASMCGKGALTVEARVLASAGSTGHIGDPPLYMADEIEITITDSGAGMPPEIAENAMDPMFTTRPRDANQGWGLSKVAGFVRQSGGSIKLRSVVDLGTCVSMRFPVAAICED